LVICLGLFSRHQLWLPVFTPLIVQLPLSLLLGMLVQYRTTRQGELNVTRALHKIVPAGIAHRLVNFADPLQPELVDGVCLMSDIEGYTTVTESLSPEQVAELSNEYFELLGARVQAHEGEIVESSGDSMCCFWRSGNHSRQTRLKACSAALEMQRAVEVFNDAHPGHGFPTRLGMRAGKVAVGLLGGGGYYTYALSGDVVVGASRIEGLNKYLGTRLLAEHSVIEGLDELLTRSVGRFRLKGKTEVLEIFEIFALVADATKEDIEFFRSFDIALRHYQAGAWNQASAALMAVLNIRPFDGPSRFYLGRCTDHVLKPPSMEKMDVVNLEVK
jgi:adenylate cyclase